MWQNKPRRPAPRRPKQGHGHEFAGKASPRYLRVCLKEKNWLRVVIHAYHHRGEGRQKIRNSKSGTQYTANGMKERWPI